MPDFEEKASKYIAEARQRAKRRKSAWNLLLVPFCFGSFLAIYIQLLKAVWAVHVFVFPKHQLSDFWPKGVSIWSFIPSFLMVFAPLPGALLCGFMVGNLLLWLVPPVRRTFDREAQDHPGTSFGKSQRALFNVAVWLLPTGMAIAFFAATLLKSLR